MAYIKKEWVNIPKASELTEEELNSYIPEGQDALARFDADNMNRIETGVEDAHNSIKNHGLGTTTPSISTNVVSMMQRGNGFYCSGGSNDSPKGANEQLSILQMVRNQTEDSETGSQIAFFDQTPDSPEMWLRTMVGGAVGDWVEMIHTGNMHSLLPFARISLGSYVGNGGNSVNYPNTLTFDFVPKIVIVSNEASNTETSSFVGSDIYGCFPWINGMTQGASYADRYSDGSISLLGVELTWSDKTLSWYNGYNSKYQLNQSGDTYYYIAIG